MSRLFRLSKGNSMEMSFTKDDLAALESLKGKQNAIREAVTELVHGYHTGLFLWGEGGLGKSFIVQQTLEEMRAHTKLHNTRMSAKGLIDVLEEFPSHIHWIEDAESLMDDKKALGVLRSACWSQSKKRPPERMVTWTASRVRIEFMFTGGILVISNCNLADASPELRAIKTRVMVLHVDLDQAEVVALMKEICQAGFVMYPDQMTPSECWQVAKFIFQKLHSLQRSLDLRLLKHGFSHYLACRDGVTSSWQNMLEMRMTERVRSFKSRVTQGMENSAIAETIRQAGGTQGEQVRAWHKKTGRG